MATWPPTLDQLKVDMNIDPLDPTFNAPLQVVLDAAVAYVEGARPEVDYAAFAAADPTERDPDKEPVTDDHVLGTLRYARRLDIRRDSPNGMIVQDQLGATPIAGWDVDIEKLLRVGRYTPMRFA